MFFNKLKKRLADAEQSLLQQMEANNQLTNENKELISKYAPLIDKDLALRQIEEQIQKRKIDATQLNDKYQQGLVLYNKLATEVNLYEDTLEIGSFGLYTPRFDYQTSEAYKNAIDLNYLEQKNMIKAGQAAICTKEWVVDGSKAEGKKMTNQYIKLILFAFNGECDSCIARVKWNNAAKTTERINKAFENINKLGVTSNVHLTHEFLQLKFDEMALAHEYDLKLHAEKEEQRRIREQMREEEKAQREYERAQREAEDEEKRFQKALDKAKAEIGTATDMQLLNQQIAVLEEKLKEAQAKKERAISLAQQTKVGHIYVISNIGSFGEDVYKIGLTRRLDPLDRVRELGDASVPFHFDVHAIIYSENAPQLEYELHQKFHNRRLNRINGRREFFKVTLTEIEDVVKQHSDAAIEFTKVAEAKEYRETLTLIERLTQAMQPVQKQEHFPASLN